MRIRPSLVLVVALAAAALLAQSAVAARPRAGYWEARIAHGGPLVQLLVAPGGRQVAAFRATARVACPDGHIHSIVAHDLHIPIDSRGRFGFSHSAPPEEFDHAGVDGWRFRGRFTTDRRVGGSVSFTWSGAGPSCSAPAQQGTWSGAWVVRPTLSVSPSPIKRGRSLTVRGAGFRPGQRVHILVPNDIIEVDHVDNKEYQARADRHGRFSRKIRLQSGLPAMRYRAQAWQGDCLTVCWVYDDVFYRVVE